MQGLDILVTTTKPNRAHRDLHIIHITQLPPKQHFRETCRTLWIDQTWWIYIPLNTQMPEEVGFEVCDPFSGSQNMQYVRYRVQLSHLASFSLKIINFFTFSHYSKFNQDNLTWFKVLIHDGLQRCFCSAIKNSYTLHFHTGSGFCKSVYFTCFKRINKISSNFQLMTFWVVFSLGFYCIYALLCFKVELNRHVKKLYLSYVGC